MKSTSHRPLAPPPRPLAHLAMVCPWIGRGLETDRIRPTTYPVNGARMRDVSQRTQNCLLALAQQQAHLVVLRGSSLRRLQQEDGDGLVVHITLHCA
eukprot:1226795-Prymnesium_polylepis.1